MSWQTVTIVGNLGRDPELRKTRDGRAVASFSLAVNEGSGDRKTTTWFSCVAWEGTAELVERYFKKGDVLLASGKIRTRTYEKDGVEKDVWELIVREIGFVGGGNGSRDERSGSSRSRDDRDDVSDRSRSRSRSSDNDDGFDDDKPAKRERRPRDLDLDDNIPF